MDSLHETPNKYKRYLYTPFSFNLKSDDFTLLLNKLSKHDWSFLTVRQFFWAIKFDHVKHGLLNAWSTVKTKSNRPSPKHVTNIRLWYFFLIFTHKSLVVTKYIIRKITYEYFCCWKHLKWMNSKKSNDLYKKTDRCNGQDNNFNF